MLRPGFMAWCQTCLDNWQAHLDRWAPPKVHGGGRPPER